MNILGIETSCDETAAAVVRDGKTILSNVIASQIDIHNEFGGVVPEVAARNHIEVILPVIEKSLTEANLSWNEIDAIGVTKGPGLPGALLVGTLTAKTLAYMEDKPIYGIDHVAAHTYANFLVEGHEPEFPILALIVSGGHTQIVLFKSHGDYSVLGKTRDDAAGEAFDKVAKLLGLPYPGGPAIAERALEGNEDEYDFPKAKLDNIYDFSFSGLKTALLRHVQDITEQGYDTPSFELAELLTERQVANTAASFQKTVVETLSEKMKSAYEEYKPETIVIAGGVAANTRLREELQVVIPQPLSYPAPHLCTDNAAMIAARAFYVKDLRDPDDVLRLESEPSLTM